MFNVCQVLIYSLYTNTNSVNITIQSLFLHVLLKYAHCQMLSKKFLLAIIISHLFSYIL